LLNLVPRAIVDTALRHNARTGSWEGVPRLACVGEVSMGVYGDIRHGVVKRMEVTLVICFCRGFCLLGHANVTKVHRPVDVELRHHGHFRAIPQC